jgi:hypothetical protein
MLMLRTLATSPFIAQYHVSTVPTADLQQQIGLHTPMNSHSLANVARSLDTPPACKTEA